jgi:transposase
MIRKDVPFINNIAENDLRIIKIQQKVLEYFKAWKGVKIFCHARSYFSIRRKNNIPLPETFNLLFHEKLFNFIYSLIYSTK